MLIVVSMLHTNRHKSKMKKRVDMKEMKGKKDRIDEDEKEKKCRQLA